MDFAHTFEATSAQLQQFIHNQVMVSEVKRHAKRQCHNPSCGSSKQGSASNCFFYSGNNTSGMIALQRSKCATDVIMLATGGKYAEAQTKQTKTKNCPRKGMPFLSLVWPMSWAVILVIYNLIACLLIISPSLMRMQQFVLNHIPEAPPTCKER